MALQHDQSRFETFLFDLSSDFIGLPEESVDVNMARGLARVGAFLELDRVSLLELSHDREEMTVAYSWSADGVAQPLPVLTRQMQPWWVGQVLRGEVTLASRVDDLPDEAAAERRYLHDRGVASIASIPLRVGGEIAGALSFVTVRRHLSWTPELVSRLKAIGDILWNALKRYQAMRALSRLNRRLLEVQEEERARVARELHDDINQRLALLVLALDGIRQRAQPAMPEIGEEIGRAIEAATSLTSDVQTLSHRLHPARLRVVGLELAAREMCRDLAERSGVEIEFRADGAAGTLPEEISVGLYRVLQEALQNAIKHSGSRRILVVLRFDVSAVTLTVQDSGAGFDMDLAAQAGGLGLITMKERLKLVDGALAIETARAGGTTIQARVPLTSRARSRRSSESS